MAPTTNDQGSGLGHIKDPYDDKDHVVGMSKLHLGGNAPLPPAFNVFDNPILGADNLRYSSYIYDQGQVGSCTTNAVASAYCYGLQRQGKNDSYKPSRLFLYYTARIPDADIDAYVKATNQGRSEYFASLANNPPTAALDWDSGSMIREVIRIIANLGAPLEAKGYIPNDAEGTWPYIHVTDDDDEWLKLPEEEKKLSAPSVKDPKDDQEYFPPGALPSRAPSSSAFSAAQTHMTFHYARPAEHVGAQDCWKQCIQNGYPIIFGFREYKGFQKTIDKPHHTAPTPTGNNVYETGHSVLAVGWDDDKDDQNGGRGCFKVQNSWGKGSGDGGFFWMPYSWLTMRAPDDAKEYMVDSPWVLIDSQDCDCKC